MKKLRKFWRSLSRKQKALTHLVCILLLLFCLYIFAGCPPVSAEHRYLRAAKDYLVGPGEILAHVELENMDYTDLVIADDGDAVIMYIYEKHGLEPSELSYRKKTSDLTVLAAPCHRGGVWLAAINKRVPVVLFDEYPQAVRAELDLTLEIDYGSETEQKTYSMESQREYEGLFLFDIYAHNANQLGAEGHALNTFVNICSNSLVAHMDVQIPATVRLYDAQGTLICEKTIYIRSTAAQAHAETE